MPAFTCAHVAAGCLILSVVKRLMRLLSAICGDNGERRSMHVTAVAFGVFASSFLSLTTLKSFRSAKETLRFTTHHGPLITVTSRN